MSVHPAIQQWNPMQDHIRLVTVVCNEHLHSLAVVNF